MSECEAKPSFKMNSSGSTNQTKPKANENIQVYVRVRPLNSRERSIGSCEVVDVVTPKEVVVRQLFDSKTPKKFTFDRAFGPESRQSEVYHSVVAHLIEEVLAGYNCTVFAYGQTGTGKTHTMIGTENPELKSSWEDESMVGIIPRAVSHLFDELRMMELEFSMRISYLELYNEKLCDLLSSDDSTKIRIFDDSTKKGSIIVQGLEEIPVHSKDDVYKLLEKGKKRRKTATTLMNAQSSRSHTVFSIRVYIRENSMDGKEMLKIGKLNLVDLAGSENDSKAGNDKGIRTRETVNKNQSLLTLGRVITALVERTPHIPYRESKLTRLLQESLGGRTKTSIITTISPGDKDLQETLSTLEYAHRAKNIQNRPEINQKLTKKTVRKRYTDEIDRLRRELMAERNKREMAEEGYKNMQCKLDSQNKELNEKIQLISALQEKLASQERIFSEVGLHVNKKPEKLRKTKNILTNTKQELTQTKTVLTKTKRRVEEKKQIVESHLKTEKVLTEQATKLIEAAEVATTDTHELHNTIERRKNVDINNETACEAFVERTENLFDDIKSTKDRKSNLHLMSEHLAAIESIMVKYRKPVIDANSKHKTEMVATTDTHELHNTIERRKNVDINNETACEAFVERTENLFDDIKSTKDRKSNLHLMAEQLAAIKSIMGKYRKPVIDANSQKDCEILEDIVSQAETETHAIAKRCSDETEGVLESLTLEEKLSKEVGSECESLLHDVSSDELGIHSTPINLEHKAL